ncbi:DUF427 domain-containing protein [Paraburkholderia caffeinilytica]|uniref:DUF427 domain-containing protein n=1 Tax=Paraburkholderia caffeinilytica TaxID=1761016 RepID=UPI0038B84B28
MLEQTSHIIDALERGAARASPYRIIVRLAGRVIADTRAAHAVGKGPASAYLIPFEDVDMHFLRLSDGIDVSRQIRARRWFDFECGSTKMVCVAWQDSSATPAMGAAGRYVVFETSRVDTIECQPLTTLLQMR